MRIADMQEGQRKKQRGDAGGETIEQTSADAMHDDDGGRSSRGLTIARL